MQLTRMDLDGTGSPMGLVGKILKAEPGLTLPIPIEEIARALDITDIQDVDSSTFEGGLVTDATRSTGYILVNRRSIRGRRRFTIGHELGHFLMTNHKPPPGGFQCSRSDMRQWDGKDVTAAMRMEFEANEFSGLLLMPPPLWKRESEIFRDPNIAHVSRLAKLFDVSGEAAARSYAMYHEQPVAMIVVKNGSINRIYRNITRFPRLCVVRGNAVPASSILFRAPVQTERPTDLVEAQSEYWLESEWGSRLPTLYEQVIFQNGGFALLMLWAEIHEEQEKDDERTSKQRFQDQQQKWVR
jgi:hypothetical protein